MTDRLDTLLGAMIAHNAGDPKRIQHFIKVDRKSTRLNSSHMA